MYHFFYINIIYVFFFYLINDIFIYFYQDVQRQDIKLHSLMQITDAAFNCRGKHSTSSGRSKIVQKTI